MKKLSVIILTLAMMLTTATAFAGTSFTDLSGAGWAKGYIDTLVGKKAIDGYPDGTFKPQGTITAAEFTKIAVVAATEVDKVEKSGKHWASGYMAVAANLEFIPEGMFTEADWDKPIDRQKMAVIMERIAQLYFKEATASDAAISGFTDNAKMCEYCKDYIAQAVKRGLVNGYADGTFRPTATATRAEATAMLVRLIDANQRVKPVEKGQDISTTISQYTSDPFMLENETIWGYKTVAIDNGDRFNLKYGQTISEKNNTFTLWFNHTGYLKGIMEDGTVDSLHQAIPTGEYHEVPCYGKYKLSEYKYLAFRNTPDSTIYVFPNPFK